MTKGERTMARVPVAVAEQEGMLRVHPGVQLLSAEAGDSLVVANATGDTIWVWFPEAIFKEGTAPRPIQTGGEVAFTLAGEPQYGFYPYAVYRSRGEGRPAPGGGFGHGNSAPGVIIKA
jgi:hypothetical protein